MKYFFLLLLFSFLCLGDLAAQVGINNPNPSQALDVGGKIKVGDDQITPEAGTIRYNRVTKTFEGYDGTAWSVFNPDPEGDGGSVPASGAVVSANRNTGSTINTLFWQTNPDGGSFSTVPAGRTLYVTYINVKGGGGAYDFLLRAETSSGEVLTRTEFGVSDNSPVRNQVFSEPNGHLIVVPSGHVLTIRKNAASAIFFVRGFLL